MKILVIVYLLLVYSHFVFADPQAKTFMDLELTTSDVGTLVKVPKSTCKTLRVYFPGHAQELGLKGSVPQKREREWAEELLKTESYKLAAAITTSTCPTLILGDSIKSISSTEVARQLNESDASSLELLSHSGGYVGLNATLESWEEKEFSKVKKVILLDNFYSENLASTLKEKFGEKKMKEICSGFYTPHNADRYKSSYSKICPIMDSKGKAEHKTAVRQYFLRH
jgi:hypothetical protein